MRIAVGHQLIRFFANGIQRNRVVHVVMDGERHMGVPPIDRTGRGIDQMLDIAVPAAFENIHESFDVAFGVGMRIDQ